MAGKTFNITTARGELILTENSHTDDAEYAYTNGQCIALSLALHEATDWPIVAHLSRAGNPEWEMRTHGRHITKDDATDGWFYYFVHSLAQSPEGWLIDIRGEHDAEDYRNGAYYDYGTCALVTVDPDALQLALADARKNGAVHMEQNMDAAASFAKILLADYERERARLGLANRG